MTPFSMQCDTCGEYIYKSKKFNAKKEKVVGEDYLGIQIFRFHIRCPKCYATISFKTDPKNTDYVADAGATRNFEPWRDEQFVQDDLKAERNTSEENNPLKALENRTIEAKREMDILDALDEIRTKNARSERVDASGVLNSLLLEKQDELLKQEEKEDELINSIYNTSDGVHVKRLLDDDSDDAEDETMSKKNKIEEESLASSSSAFVEKKVTAASLGIVLKPKKKPNKTGLTLLGAYGSDSERE
jgi:hypothetical protein